MFNPTCTAACDTWTDVRKHGDSVTHITNPINMVGFVQTRHRGRLLPVGSARHARSYHVCPYPLVTSSIIATIEMTHRIGLMSVASSEFACVGTSTFR